MAAATEFGTALRPICAACRQPLHGDLVASRCNHVFHRECLNRSQALRCEFQCSDRKIDRCPKCNDYNWIERPVDLYGINFSEATGESSSDLAILGALQAKKKQPSHEEIEDSDIEVVQPVSAVSGAAIDDDEDADLATVLFDIFKMKDQQRQQEDESSVSEIERAQEMRQHKKLTQIQAKHAESASHCESKVKKLGTEKDRNEALLDEVDRIRSRDTPLEYGNMLSNDPTAACAFLKRSACFLQDPALLITDLNRWVTHTREKFKKEQRDNMQVTKKEQQAKRTLEQMQQDIQNNQRKLQRLSSSSSLREGSSTESLGSRQPTAPPASSRPPLHELQPGQLSSAAESTELKS